MPLPIERLDTFSGDAITDLMANVALGQIPDARLTYIYGHTPAIPTGTTSVMWQLDGAITTTGFRHWNVLAKLTTMDHHRRANCSTDYCMGSVRLDSTQTSPTSW